MNVSVFDLFKVGVGPSSSHTVGPMIAARRFLLHLQKQNLFDQCQRVVTRLHGSLAHTGKGHASSSAILMGLQGERPDLIDAPAIPSMIRTIIKQRSLSLLGQRPIPFIRKRDVIFDYQYTLPEHPNGLTFDAFDHAGLVICSRKYYSVGGGFVLSEDEINSPTNISEHNISEHNTYEHQQPYPFSNATILLEQCQRSNLSIAQLMMNNELAQRSENEINQGLTSLWSVMDDCINLGCHNSGHLPGGLDVSRRAPELFKKLSESTTHSNHYACAIRCDIKDSLQAMDWVNLFALAVNEQNAAGGRVVTAPTNGAAGIIPAVLAYFLYFVQPTQTQTSTPSNKEQGIKDFLLTSAAIGSLFKENASISAAEVGCQGEVGVACSMAAAGLTAVLGGTNAQIENAAEIGMEHNLGLTCDPIKGLVQIPCIERNTMGAVQAINASRLALSGNGQHKVTLDQVIETMRQTGKDMQDKYKETSKAGLAVNFIEC